MYVRTVRRPYRCSPPPLFPPYEHAGLIDQGEIQFVTLGTDAEIVNLKYKYDVREDNNNIRTLQRMSTEAAKEFLDCQDKSDCYHDDYAKFVQYYGDTDYGDKWVMAAATGVATDFSSGRGNADFAIMAGNNGHGRAEAMTHGTIFLNLWMYLIHQMEMAIQYCRVPCTDSTKGECEEDAVHAWDSALAYYAGSIEGQNGEGDGYLLYALADARSREFKTAGYLSDEVHGTSYANLEAVHLFSQGQSTLTKKTGNQRCNELGAIKERIVNLMKVPLVQTVLRYAWKRHYETGSEEKYEAKGASYAASLLPYVEACKASHANFLYETLKVGSSDQDINFGRLKTMLEEIYPCLGITCAQVGGLYKDDDYLGGADPCFDTTPIVDRSPASSKNDEQDDSSTPTVIIEEKGGANVGIALGVSLAVLMVIAILGLAWLHLTSAKKRAKSLEDQQQNIAAVTAVSEVDMA